MERDFRVWMADKAQKPPAQRQISDVARVRVHSDHRANFQQAQVVFRSSRVLQQTFQVSRDKASLSGQ